jgi:hypothetical protein
MILEQMLERFTRVDAVYALSTATLNVSVADSNMTVNSGGVAKVLTALKALTPLGTAKLKGTSGAKGLWPVAEC